MVRSIVQWVSSACIAFVVALTGYWYIQGLHQRINNLENSLSEAVETLTEVRGAIGVQNTVLKNWRASQERLEASQRATRDKIEYVLKTSKGNGRVVSDAVINELCSASGGKYCTEELRTSTVGSTNNANSTVQDRNTKG